MEEKQPLMDVATLDDFEHIDPSSILALSNSLHFHTLERTFLKASQEAETRGDGAAVRAYKVLAVICSYHFNPDRPDTFTPQLIMDGQRTLIPSDFVGEQQDILVEIVEKFDHPLLRARIADSCWYMNRKLHEMAMLAVPLAILAADMAARGSTRAERWLLLALFVSPPLVGGIGETVWFQAGFLMLVAGFAWCARRALAEVREADDAVCRWRPSPLSWSLG